MIKIISTKTINTVLLLPAIFWSVMAIVKLIKDGLVVNSYTTIIPFPFEMHSLSLLNMTSFYIIIFLFGMDDRPIKNFSIAVLLIFLFNIIYEAIFSIYYDITGTLLSMGIIIWGIVFLKILDKISIFLTQKKMTTAFLLSCGLFILIILIQGTSPEIYFSQLRFNNKQMVVFMLMVVFVSVAVFLIVLNQIFGFLTTDKRKISLAILIFCGFLLSIYALSHTSFFTELHIFLDNPTAKNPHNPLWLLTKITGLWGFYPLIEK